MISFQIAEPLKGHVTLRDLIHASGTYVMESFYSQLGGDHIGILCKISSDIFDMEMGVTDTHIYFLRNGYKVEMLLKPVYEPIDFVMIFFMWDAISLSIIMLDAASKPSPDDEGFVEFTRKVYTPQTVPPYTLIQEAKKILLIPELTYKSRGEIYSVVTSAIVSIQDTITETNMYNSFWSNINENGLIRRHPKRETEVHSIFHALLYDLCMLRNLEITPECNIANGRLDFLISGSLDTGERVHTCIEFKNAHSKDLVHGYTHQLPAYMKSKGADLGIYCVLCYKGDDFNEPADYGLNDLQMVLAKDEYMMDCAYKMRILILDLSFPKPPSKK